MKNKSISKENLRKVGRVFGATLYSTMVLSCFSVDAFASAAYAQNTVISLNLENTTLRDAFKEIEKNSDFVIFYNESILDSERKVKIHIKEKTVAKILDELFAGTNNTYRVEDKQIYITKKDFVAAETKPTILEKQQAVRKKITGKVFDSFGETLPGAAIMVVGSTRGVTTDIDGSFSLDVLPTEKIIISFLGLESQTVQVGSKNSFIFKLQESVDQLDEVTVVAFGKQKKASIVSSIEAIDPKFLKAPSSNLTTSFAGRMAGLISYQRSGEPGKDNADFFVRGVTTFGYAQSPLILLDGFEISADDLARVEPDDIEQFAVLKDATAAALYGSKGANGVITVTTKQGEAGAPKVTFRHDSRFSAPTTIPETVDAVTYMNLYNQAQFNDNPLLSPYYSSQKIQNTMSNLNPYAYPNVDWYDEMFKDFTYNQHYNLNVSGGGTAVRYYLSASYNKDTGILKDNSLNNFKNNININRFNLVAKVNIDLTKTTRIEINMNSVFEDFTGPKTDATTIFNNVMEGNPVEFPKFYEPDVNTGYIKHTLFGSNATGDMINPYAEMVSGYKDGFKNAITSQFVFEQDLDFLTEGLTFRAKASIKSDGSYSSKRTFDPYYYNIKSYDELNDEYILQEVKQGTQALGNPATERTASSRMYYEVGLSYNKKFNDLHDVGAVVIYTQEETKNTSGGETIQATLPARNQGIRGRVNYGYDGRYLAEASLTYNGSEKFNSDHQWGMFPAIGVGYVMSEESFWEPLSNVVNKFKLKYSYGKVGNDNIASPTDRFFFLSDIGSSSGYAWGKDFNSNYGGFSINRYANPFISWEISTKQNIGVEIGLLNNIDLQVEYFTEQRESIYQAREHLPASMGLTSSVYGNVGEVASQGFDGSIDLNHSFNKDAWITGRFNFTYATNEIIENEEPEYKYSYLSKKGHAVNQVFGYVAERLFIDSEDVNNSPSQELGGQVQAGDIKYKDINNDGRVNSDDKVAIGHPTVPELNYGFGLSGGYKAFDLSFFFQGQGSSSFFIDPSSIAPFTDNRNALQYIADDHWSPNNPVSQSFWPRLSASDNDNNYQQYSTWWMRDGKVLRLKSLELGYTLPKSVLKKSPLKYLRIYLSGSNLFAISTFDLWDPEMGSNGLGYPLQRVYNIGVNLSF